MGMKTKIKLKRAISISLALSMIFSYVSFSPFITMAEDDVVIESTESVADELSVEQAIEVDSDIISDVIDDEPVVDTPDVETPDDSENSEILESDDSIGSNPEDESETPEIPETPESPEVSDESEIDIDTESDDNPEESDTTEKSEDESIPETEEPEDVVEDTVSGNDIPETETTEETETETETEETESENIIQEADNLQEFSDEIANLNQVIDLDSNSYYTSKRLLVVSNTSEFDTCGAESAISLDTLYVLQYASEEEAKSAFKALQSNDDILSVEVDIVAESNTTGESTPVVDTSTPDIVPTQPGLKIAVIDSGVDYNNALFKDRIINLGLNLSTSGSQNDIMDDNGHGTAVASIIAKNSNAQIVPIKIANQDGKGTVLNLYLAIKMAIENDVDIINISLTASPSSLVTAITKEAIANGVVVVAAAGNQHANVDGYTPADVDGVIAVAATNQDYTPAEYSNYGEKIDYAAVGTDLLVETIDGTVLMSGTSLSAAYVSAIMSYAHETGQDFSTFVRTTNNNPYYFGNGIVSLEDVNTDKIPDIDIDAWNEEGDWILVAEDGTVYDKDSIMLAADFTQNSVKYTYSSKTLTITGTGTATNVWQTHNDTWKGYVTKCTKIKLNSATLTSVDANAFSGCTALKTVEIAAFNNGTFNSLCFKGITTITKIVLTNATSVTTFGSNVFEGCTGLVNIGYTNSSSVWQQTFRQATSIGASSFKGCTSLATISTGNYVTSIGANAFDGCKALTTVTIGSGLTTIGSNAFANCPVATLTWGAANVTSGGNAFAGKTTLTKLSLKDTVVSIPDYFMDGNTNLQSAVTASSPAPAKRLGIPSSITSIGNYAFRNCSSIVRIGASYDSNSDGTNEWHDTTRNVTMIGTGAFRGCSSLTKLGIGAAVTTVNDYAFYDCTSLTTTTIGKNAKTIHTNVFGGTTPVGTLKIQGAINNTSSSSSYGSPFKGRTGITSVEITSTGALIDSMFEGCTGMATLKLSDSTVTSIPANCFKGCTHITTFTIPNTVTTIGTGAFRGCTSIPSVTIPNAVTTINDYAFYGCTSLTTTTFGTGVTTLGANTFKGNTPIGVLTIKSDISGHNNAFQGHTGITELTFSNAVTTIYEGMFKECTGMTKLKCGTGITTVGKEAFLGCSGLCPHGVNTSSLNSNVTYPANATSVGAYAFRFYGTKNNSTPNHPTITVNQTVEWDNKASRIGKVTMSVSGTVESDGNTMQAQAKDYVLIIDTSNSMKEAITLDDGTSTNLMEVAKTSAKYCVEQIAAENPYNRICIVSMGAQREIAYILWRTCSGDDLTTIYSMISDMNYTQIRENWGDSASGKTTRIFYTKGDKDENGNPVGHTQFAAAMKIALRAIQMKGTTNNTYCLFISDGEPTDKSAVNATGECLYGAIEGVWSVAIGASNVDQETYMKQVSSSDDKYTNIPKNADLDDKMNQIVSKFQLETLISAKDATLSSKLNTTYWDVHNANGLTNNNGTLSVSGLTLDSTKKSYTYYIKLKDAYKGSEADYLVSNYVNAHYTLENGPDAGKQFDKPNTTSRSLRWDTYSITYNANGGTGTTASQTKPYGESINIRTNGFTRTGYVFKGWNTKADGTGTSYSAGVAYSANADLALYAQWKAVYSITYNGNGNTGGSTAKQTFESGSSVKISANGFTKTGNVFVGWNTKADGTGTSYAVGATYNTKANLTLYAQWIARFDVTYAYSWGTSYHGSYPATVEVEYQNKYPTLANPSRYYRTTFDKTSGTYLEKSYLDAYSTFDGWYLESTFQNKITPNSTIVSKTSAHTIYAKWTNGNIIYPLAKKEYTVTFNPNNTDKDTGTVEVEKLTEKWQFDGWYKDAALTQLSGKNGYVEKSVGSNKTLYAKWTDMPIVLPEAEMLFTLTFDVNGGVEIDEDIQPAELLGFFTTAKTGGTRIGTTGDNYTVDKDHTVYARWGKAEFVLPDCEKEDCAFVGWFNQPQGSETDELELVGRAGDTVLLEESQTVYAWFNTAPVLSQIESTILYEGQTVKAEEMFQFVECTDLEDDALSNELEIELVSVEYIDGETEDIDKEYEIETSTKNIGEFKITFSVTDAGLMVGDTMYLDTMITVEEAFVFEINYNDLPQMDLSPAMYVYSDDSSLTKDTIADFLKSCVLVTDKQDDEDNKPWWLAEDSQKLLEESIVIEKISDITINPAYAIEHKSTAEAISNVSSVEELYAYKNSNPEAFNAILSFRVTFDATDQFGKCVSGTISDELSTKGVLAQEEDAVQSENDRSIMVVCLNINAADTTYESVRSVNEKHQSTIDSNSYWGDSEYGGKELDEIFDKKSNKESEGHSTQNGSYNQGDNNIDIIINDYSD